MVAPRLIACRPARDVHLRLLYGAFGSALGVWIPFVAIVLQARGFDPPRVGLLLGCSSLGTVAAMPVWSTLADRYVGNARALRWALVAGALAAVGLALTGGNVAATAVLFVAFGATVGPTTGLIDSLALEHLRATSEIRYGAFRLFGSLGWAVTVTALGAVLQVTGLGVMFPVCATAFLAWAALATRFPTTVPVRVHAAETRFGSAVDAIVRSPRLRVFLLGLLLVNIGSYGAWNFLPLRIAGLGGGPFIVGLGPGLGALLEAPLMVLTVPVILRSGLRGCYMLGAGVYVLQLLLFAAVTNPVVLAAVYIARGAGFAFAYVAAVRIAGALAPAHARSAAQLLQATVTLGLGPLVGSVAGGFVYSYLGAPALFLMCAGTVAAGAVVVGTATAALHPGGIEPPSTG